MTERRSHMTDLPEAPPPAIGRPAGSDVLSEVLRAVRLRGAVFYTVKASATWAIEAPHTREFAHIIIPGSEHVIAYHVVSHGSCYAYLPDEVGPRLEAGDVIVFPQGDPHVMASACGMRAPVDIEHHEA